MTQHHLPGETDADTIARLVKEVARLRALLVDLRGVVAALAGGWPDAPTWKPERREPASRVLARIDSELRTK